MAKSKTQKTIKKEAPKKEIAKKKDNKPKVAVKSAVSSKAAKANVNLNAKKAATPVVVSDKGPKKGATSEAKLTGKPASQELLKSTPVKAVASKTAKPAATKGKGKGKKTETKEDDFDADIDTDGFGDSEIAEYEDDLKAVEEIDDIEVADVDSDEDTDERDQEVYLTDSEGRRLCRVRDCDQVAVTDGYCRYHYLLLWKKIQIRKSILQDGKLEKYILDLTTRYPDKYLEAIKKDLRTEKDFLSVVQELEIDESAIGEIESGQDEEVQSFSDEFRGIGETTPSMDDDGDF